MSFFKQIIKDDLDNVIFNADEFSETHTIMNNKTKAVKTVRAITDKSELLERTGGKSSEYKGGLYLDQTLLYVNSEDYGARPAVGSIITLDSKKIYKIVDVNEENGIYILTLEVNKA